ncbi:MAG TPA: hypothetical protein VHP83_24045 [Aggregatilineaceae bacterium]|nr:hypothetical protein [Aggregatilineaceae bacterium]
MSRQLQKLPDEPIILETLYANYSIAELAAGREEGQRLLDTQVQPVVWIADMRAASTAFIEEFMQIISRVSRNDTPQPYLRGLVYVLPPEYVNEMRQKLMIPLFDNLDDAFQQARSILIG